MRFDPGGLTVAPYLPRIGNALAAGPLVLVAETGAGKTTAVPPSLAASGAIAGRILVLEPRRLAARSSAARAAELCGERTGLSVGYRVRGDSRIGPGTLVEYVTEALFLRIIQDDPLLEGVGLVAFDEFHERSLASDLCLAFVMEAMVARPELRVLIMSATMDADAVSRFLSCPSVSVPGRSFPVSVEYRPPRPGSALEDAIASAAAEASVATQGDVLVFVPGAREARDVAARLGSLGSGAEIVHLRGSMPLDDQARVLSPLPGGRKRVILATSVAETSLTVPGVTAVVDSGLSRFSRFHRRSGMNRLVTERLSLAEAEQRRGRAGRTGPGTCLRCWDPSDLLEASRGPEIFRAELSGAVLECAARGVRDPGALRWLDPPDPEAWAAGAAALRGSGLIDGEGSITRRGARAVGLGLDARPAAAVVAALDSGDAPLFQASVLLAALLGERAGESAAPTDMRPALEAALSSGKVLDEAARICRKADGGFDPELASAGIPRAGDAMAAGFPDRLARPGPDGLWEFGSGRRASMPADMPADMRSGWIVALELDAGDPLGRIWRALPVDEAAARAALAVSATERLELGWKGLSCQAWMRLSAGRFVLRERRLPDAPLPELAEALRSRLASEGPGWLPWDEATRALLDRVRYAARLGRLRGAAPEDWTDASLSAGLSPWLEPYLSARGDILDPASLATALADRLGPGAMDVLEEEAPAFVASPGGRRRRPTYPPSGDARLAMRIQEAFGMRRSPAVCGRALVLELLSPADRPVQVSSDLASFWAAAYPALRPELARRYPRHYWPENPLAAEPTRGPPPGR